MKDAKLKFSILNSASHCPLLYLHFISLRRVWPPDMNTLLFRLPWEKEVFSLMSFTTAHLNTWILTEHTTLLTNLAEQREGREISTWEKKERVRWLSCLIVHFLGTLLNSWLISSEPGPAETHMDDCCILSHCHSLLCINVCNYIIMFTAYRKDYEASEENNRWRVIYFVKFP